MAEDDEEVSATSEAAGPGSSSRPYPSDPGYGPKAFAAETTGLIPQRPAKPYDPTALTRAGENRRGQVEVLVQTLNDLLTDSGKPARDVRSYLQPAIPFATSERDVVKRLQEEIIAESKEFARVQGKCAQRRGFEEGKNFMEGQNAKEDGRETVQKAKEAIETLTREKEKLERELKVAKEEAAPQLKQQLGRYKTDASKWKQIDTKYRTRNGGKELTVKAANKALAPPASYGAATVMPYEAHSAAAARR
jgi:hypothetical protein